MSEYGDYANLVATGQDIKMNRIPQVVVHDGRGNTQEMSWHQIQHLGPNVLLLVRMSPHVRVLFLRV